MKQSTLSQDLQTLQNEVQQAELKKFETNAQLADLQKRYQQLQADFDTKTTELLGQQRHLLTQDREKLLEKFAVLQKKLKDIYKEIREAQKLAISSNLKAAQLTDLTKSLERQVDILRIDKETTLIQRSSLKKEIISCLSQLEQAKHNNIKLVSQNSDTESKISAMHETEKELQMSIDQKNRQIIELEQKNREIDAKIDERTAIKRRELNGLLEYEKKTREDLAHRQLILDEREQNVTIRERKADVQEQTIEHNANLLEL